MVFIMSSDLTWQLLRGGSHAFTIQKKSVGHGRIWSKEAGNLMNVHSYKNSGLANARTIDIVPNADGEKGCVLTVRTKAGLRKPKVSSRSVTLKRGARKAVKSAAGATNGSFYRSDLTQIAMARASKILMGQRPVKEKVRKGRKTASA